MKKNTLCFWVSLWFVICSIGSCEQNQNKIPVIGEIDTVAIALDTAMQLGLESSYEYHKSLVVSENLVYDVVGFGGTASKGEFAILRRGAGNKTDTIVKELRSGTIADAFFDIESTNKLCIVIQSPADSSENKTLKYDLVQNKK